MGMVVRSNIMAINANRQLGMNNSQVSKSLEKLSSGFRINRAGDDASGLAISEKMKAQIKGLETASANSQDGISLIQTAEGALTEVHDMLNRMVELCGKAANGTMDEVVDRPALQKEVKALLDEIDRIAQGTNFNGRMLLNGELDAVTGAAATVGAAVGAETTTVGELTFAEGVTDEEKIALNKALADGGLSFTLSNGTAAGDTIAAPTLTGYTVKVLDDGGTDTTTTADVKSISIQDAEGNVVATMDLEIAGADTDGNVTLSFEVANENAKGGLTLQIGDTADTYNKMTITIQDMSTEGLGIDTIDISTQQGASDALALLKNSDGTGAINTVSTVRADLGALQNRLEHTINNLDVAAENMNSANSRIRDTDMAKQMMEYTKMNVLTQAAQAMLAQANQQPQSVLQLLQ